jgi:hypothetical protein
MGMPGVHECAVGVILDNGVGTKETVWNIIASRCISLLR